MAVTHLSTVFCIDPSCLHSQVHLGFQLWLEATGRIYLRSGLWRHICLLLRNQVSLPILFGFHNFPLFPQRFGNILFIYHLRKSKSTFHTTTNCSIQLATWPALEGAQEDVAGVLWLYTDCPKLLACSNTGLCNPLGNYNYDINPRTL